MNDVVTLGETMLRLNPPLHDRLETASELQIRVGGSESNVAIALTRLGRSCRWYSRLPDNPLGRRIAGEIARWGVDVGKVEWVGSERAGLYFVEFGSPPRAHEVYYDRKESAASTMSPETTDWSILEGWRHLHLTGITPALSPSCRATVETAIQRARKLSMTISFDVNYRSRLWPAEKAAACLRELMEGVDLILGTATDVADLFGTTGNCAEQCRRLKDRFHAPAAVVTAGAEGSAAMDEKGRYEVKPINLVEVDRFGAGDAFAAGVLHGYLGGDLGKGLELGNAMAALKFTIPGDALVATDEEIGRMVTAVKMGYETPLLGHVRW